MKMVYAKIPTRLIAVVIFFTFSTAGFGQTFTGNNLNTDFGGANGTPQIITSTANVSLTGTIGNNYEIENVLLNINHTWVGDVIARLISPSGNSQLVLITLDDNLNDGDNFTNTIIQDGGADLNTGNAPFTGNFQATGGLFSTAFAGENVNGNWTLELEDRFAPEDDGTLLNFEISFVSSDLSISLSANNATPDVNNQVTFTLTAENLGNLDDTGVSVDAPLPGGFSFDNVSGGTYNASTGVWDIGNLNGGSSTTLSIIATATIAGSSTFIASISGDETDANLSNNQVSLTLPISCSNDLVSETTNYGTIQANWRFDGNTNDSENSFNAVAGAPTNYSSDFLEGTGSAFFDGSATVQYSDGTFLNQVTNVISIAGWIKPSNLTGQRIIFDEGGDFNGFALWMDDDVLTLSTRNGGNSTQINVAASAALQLDEWQHVAGVFDNGRLRIYLNGIEDSTTASYTSIPGHGNPGGLGGEIGGDTAIGGSPSNFIGLLDGFVYSNSNAFTASQILADTEQDCVFTGNCPEPTTKQTPVTDVLSTYRERPEQLSLYTDSGNVYSYGVGTENDLRLDAFVIEDPQQGQINFAFESLADRVELRRVNNDNISGDYHILFFEIADSYGGSNKDFKGNYFATMEEALLCQCINRGSDNVFANQGTNSNNIERLDFIFDDGITVPNNPEEVGFIILERGGNDDFNLAPIESLDANGDPSSYRNVNQYFIADWDTTPYNLTTTVVAGFSEAPNNERLTQTAELGSQNVGAIFISFEDLGFCPGETIYGYSLAGGDSTTDPVAFVDFTNENSFPTTTDANSNGAGGLDLLSGGAVSTKSFIHVPGGWFDDQDPSGIVDCDERVVISGGDAQFTQNTTVGSLSVNEGSATLNSNTLSVCKDVEALSDDFQVKGGTLEMIGTTGKQFIKGRGSMIVDRLVSTNSDGVDVDAPVRIDGSIDVQSGTVDSKGNLTFYCDFSGNNPKTGMIDDLSNGSLVGDVTTQQCFPGRRAFRFVTSTVTTTGPIRQYWQENASAWNDNPVPGYGTHITGLGVQNGTPTNDGLNGFDWQPSGDPSLFVFDNAAGTWSPIDNTNVNNLQVGDPYRIMLRGSRDVNIQFNASPSSNTILRGTGPIAKGPVTYADPGFGQNLNDVILIGNPFQAIVDLQVTLNQSSNIRSFVQVYDPTLGGIENDGFLGGRGAFTTIDLTNNNLEEQSSNPDSDANKFLQAYQAVYFLASGSGQPSIVFEETQKRIQEDQTIIFSEPVSEPKIVVKLYDQTSFNAGSTSRDAVSIKFGENFSNTVNTEDAPKLANADENLARMIQGDLISLEKRSLPEDGEILPLFVNQYRMTNYVFSIDVKDFDQSTKVYLKDNYTDELHELDEGKNEVFFNINTSINATVAFNRFSLMFENETLSTEDLEKNTLQVYPNPVEDVLHIQLPYLSDNSVQVQLFDMLGKRVYNQKHEANNGSLQINQLDINQGAYILKVITNNSEVYSQKLLKK